jgi:hypothetical protein
MTKIFVLAIVSLNLVPFTQKKFVHDILCDLMEKSKQTYVLFLLEKCHCTIINFDI